MDLTYPKAISWPLQQKKSRYSSTRYWLYPQCATWLSAILSLQTLLLHALFADLRMLLKWAPPKQSSTSQLASWKNVPASNSKKNEMRIYQDPVGSWKGVFSTLEMGLFTRLLRRDPAVSKLCVFTNQNRWISQSTSAKTKLWNLKISPWKRRFLLETIIMLGFRLTLGSESPNVQPLTLYLQIPGPNIESSFPIHFPSVFVGSLTD